MAPGPRDGMRRMLPAWGKPPDSGGKVNPPGGGAGPRRDAVRGGGGRGFMGTVPGLVAAADGGADGSLR